MHAGWQAAGGPHGAAACRGGHELGQNWTVLDTFPAFGLSRRHLFSIGLPGRRHALICFFFASRTSTIPRVFGLFPTHNTLRAHSQPAQDRLTTRSGTAYNRLRPRSGNPAAGCFMHQRAVGPFCRSGLMRPARWRQTIAVFVLFALSRGRFAFVIVHQAYINKCLHMSTQYSKSRANCRSAQKNSAF